MPTPRPIICLLLASFCLGSLSFAQEDNQPPEGYTAIFNGQDLSGWYGLKQMNPRDLAEMTGNQRERMRDVNFADVKAHWTVENGELVNDGVGVYLATERDYRDFDLWIDYKTVAKADSGIYLRGNPQVQIWDFTEEGGKWNLGADKGSGGLWNNSAGAPGKDPTELADKPFGQWNRFRIQQVGSRTSIWLNGKKIVHHAIMENFSGFGGKALPHVAQGPIQLQTHGGEIRWRNIFIREIGGDEANQILASHGEDEGFESVFNGKDFTGWAGPLENYVINNGEVTCKPEKGGTIYTTQEYGDFVVRLEIKLPHAGNNGLALRYPGQGDAAYSGMCELQVLDTGYPAKLDPRQVHGSAYGMVAAATGYLRPAGEWNFQEVTVKGSTIRVELNGSVILDTDLADVTEFMGGSPHPGKDLKRGHFGFAGHSDPVTFRNIRIKPLSGSSVAAGQLQEADLGSTRNVHRIGKVFFAGQPSPDDVGELQRAGIRRVLDLRGEGEVDWDEPTVVKEAGLAYERLAFRTPESLSDDVFDRAREVFSAVKTDDQGLLCHCGGANRVGAVWLVHRVLDQGVPWDEALDEAQRIGLKTPAYVDRAQEYIGNQSK